MIGMILRVAIFLAVGIAIGIAHSRSIADGERIHRETGERARPAVLFAIRFVLVCIAFALIGKAGPLPLGAAIVGFFLVRWWKRRG